MRYSHYLLLLLFIASLAYAAAPVRFAVIGDRTGGHTPGVYEEIILEIERLKPDFTMTVGDMIEGYTDDTTELRRQWEEYLAIVAPLSAPIHYTPGNHDITTGEDDGSVAQVYRHFVEPPYHSFNYQNTHLIVLDNSRWDKSDDLPDEQINWLIADLKKNRKTAFTMVFFHKPFWFETLALGKRDRLHDIFREQGVDAVFTGHFHTYFSGEYDGILYTGIGSSSGATEPDVTGLMYHFGWITVNEEGIHVAVIKKDSVLPWDQVTAEDLHLVSEMERSAIQFAAPVRVGESGVIAGDKVVVRLLNPSGKQAVQDTLCWEVVDGWTATPPFLPVALGAGDSLSAEFTVSCDGSLFPSPVVGMRLPYREGRDGAMIRQPLPIQRVVRCSRTGGELNFDGVPDETLWRQGEMKFFAPQGGVSQTDPETFFFAWNDSALLLAAVCEEIQPDKIAATVKERDGAVYGEDCAGFFLCPPGPGEQQFVFQLYINPEGVVFDQRITVVNDQVTALEREWNGEYEIKTARGERYWSFEALIPLSQLNASARAGDEWRVNFRRKQKRLNTSADWQIPIGYEPAKYGLMILQ